MLGETKGTSAGGKDGNGQVAARARNQSVLPAAPRLCRATVSSSCIEAHPMEVFLLNTGRVGGDEGRRAREEGEDPALLGRGEGDRRRHDHVERDPDFGYEIATHVPGIEDADQDLLAKAPLRCAGTLRRVQPDRLWAQGRPR